MNRTSQSGRGNRKTSRSRLAWHTALSLGLALVLTVTLWSAFAAPGIVGGARSATAIPLSPAELSIAPYGSSYLEQREPAPLAAANTAGWFWITQTVTSTVGRIFYPSLVISDTEHANLVFMDDKLRVRFARWTGGNWDVSQVADNAAVYQQALAIDSAGNPHIAFWDTVAKDLRYAKWTGSSWDIQTVDSVGDVGHEARLGLDANDYPHISYARIQAGDVWALKYARWNGASWEIETVDVQGKNVQGSSLDLDTAGNAHISYAKAAGGGNRGSLAYAYWNGGAWSIEVVDAEELYYSPWSWLTLDSTDTPHICYTGATRADVSTAELRYAVPSATGWMTETLEGPEYRTSHCTLVLGPVDNPYISYRAVGVADNRARVRFTRQIEGKWYSQIVAEEKVENDITDPSMALDDAHSVHIAYAEVDYTNYPTLSVKLLLAQGDAPAIEIVKSANTPAAALGTVIIYTYDVLSNYSRTLQSISATDDRLGLVSLDKTSLARDEAAVGVRTYVATEDDLPGPLVNTVTVTASSPVGDPVVATSSATVALIANPSIVVAKTASHPAVYVGETVTYTYRMTNTGDVTLNSLAVLDDKLGLVPLDKDSLAPDEVAVSARTYVATWDDLPGPLVNTVTVTTSPPVGDLVVARDSATCTVLPKSIFLPLVKR